MKVITLRIVGAIVIIAGLAGMVVSIAGVIVVRRSQDTVTAGILRNVDLLSNALDTTSAGLTVADQSLQTALDNVIALEGATDTIAQAIHDFIPATDTLQTAVGKDGPEGIARMQASLNNMAAPIETMETVLALVPFSSYEPVIYTDLQQFSSDLDDWQAIFADLEKSVADTGDNLILMENDVQNISRQISQISTSLSDTRTVVAEYDDIVINLQDQIDSLQTRLPDWIKWAYTGIYLFLVWLGVAQIGIVFQGASLIQRAGESEVDEDENKADEEQRVSDGESGAATDT